MFEKMPEIAAVLSLSTVSALGALSFHEQHEAEPQIVVVDEGYMRREDRAPGVYPETDGELLAPMPTPRSNSLRQGHTYSHRRTYGRSGQLPNRTRGDVRSVRMR